MKETSIFLMIASQLDLILDLSNNDMMGSISFVLCAHVCGCTCYRVYACGSLDSLWELLSTTWIPGSEYVYLLSHLTGLRDGSFYFSENTAAQGYK